MAIPEEFVEIVFITIPAVVSKKLIVFPETADERVAVSFTDWPGVIPPDGMAEPSVLVMAKAMDCGVVLELMRFVDIQTVELLDVAQFTGAGAINNTCLSAALIIPSPEKFASIVCVPVN